MFRPLLFIFFLSSLYAQKPLPYVIDFKEPNPSCHLNKATWQTGQLAFNGAPELGTFLAYLKTRFQIDTAVETGTYLGNTTAFLALLFDEVYTVEVVESTFRSTMQNLSMFPNVNCLLGSSEIVLAKILPSLKGKPVLFYLDAHWEDQWPLKQELIEISKTHRDHCVVIIDDFKVPGRPDIPYDRYGPHECSYQYIKQELDHVFSSYQMHYIIPANPKCRAKFVAYPN